MVNTRRMESIGSTGSTPDINKRHLTRGTVKVAAASGSSSEKESDCEDSNLEAGSSDNSSQKFKEPLPQKDPKLPSRIRQLRSRFVYERKFTSRPLRSSHKHLSLNERHSLAVYSNRNMHNDSDIYNNGNDSEEEMYSRSRRSRQHRTHLTRIQRRTALSLRPISQKCYTDPHSPLQFNSDSEGDGVRRSKRKRKSASWLTDDQMHKVGYPNLNSGYSEDEEDSRDAPEPHRGDLEVTRRVTRHSLESNRREIKNPKYLYDYDTAEVSPRRRRSETLHTRNDKDLRNRRESNDKENKEETTLNGRLNGRLRSNKLDINIKKEIDDENDQPSSSKSSEDHISKDVNGEGDLDATNETKHSESSEGDETLSKLARTRTKTNNNRLDGAFTAKRTRNQKRNSSSESEEQGRKGYSLRDRIPKPAPKTIQTSVLRSTRELRSRRHFNRHRQVSSSSSDSSSSEDVRHSKPPKSPHSKNERMKSGAGGSSKIIPIRPETLDSKTRFNSIGGLDSHIQCLKEMILLPMMYPEVFNQFQIQPPRGVLFHGPPGTGKTLIARALANECSFGTRKVAFFMRKGADLLSKWIGESEKQLRLLFEQAAEMKPSIIFFDELDGLAPVRSSRQDQVHASIVSTLLALMDGLDNRGEVIVIGATNRIDSIDPALRRPGRFDRELFFPLPSRKEREEILRVHVSQWAKPPNQQLISYLAENSVGYCGSDLRALCSEAVIMGFRRSYPQVYSSEFKLLLNPENVMVEKVDFMRAKSLLVPASQRVTHGLGRKLLPILEPILQEPLKNAFGSLEQTFPHGLNMSLSKVKLSPNLRPAQLLLTGDGPEHGQTLHLAPAILFKMEHIHAYLLDLATLFRETGRSPEEACIQVFNEAKRNVPSIVYIPSIDKWWELVSETVRSILVTQLSQLDPNIPILFLATADTTFENLPVEIHNIFSHYRKEVCHVNPPNKECRRLFFKPLVVDSSLRPPRTYRRRIGTPPPLPRAPTPPPTPITEDQAKRMYETEEHTLRELRIFLRDMCKKLANNKLFYMFTKPVDTEEVPDYTNIITQPMDLETMMTKVDFHRYECAKDFLTDIELICHNALEYNPARSSADKQIRHRACSLRDYAYTLIKNEMDSDFEDKCQDIAKKRRDRKACVSKYLPAYINTPENTKIVDKTETEVVVEECVNENETEEKPTVEKIEETRTARISPHRKRKFSWQRGCLTNRKRKRVQIVVSINPAQDLNESKNLSLDESKELNQETDSPEQSEVIANVSGEPEEAITVTESILKPTAPLTVNCDTPSVKMELTSPLQSPKSILNFLMSPSELLEDPLEFDDVDQAINESEEHPVSKSAVECSKAELEKILDFAVKATKGHSLNALLDLYNQLNRILKRYARVHIRNSLPKELAAEITRFKIQDAETDLTNESAQTQNK